MGIRDASCNSTIRANSLAAPWRSFAASSLEGLVDEVWEVAEDAPVAFVCHSPDCDHAMQDVLGSHVQDLRRPFASSAIASKAGKQLSRGIFSL